MGGRGHALDMGYWNEIFENAHHDDCDEDGEDDDCGEDGSEDVEVAQDEVALAVALGGDLDLPLLLR